MTLTADQLTAIVRGGLRGDGTYSLPVAALDSEAATAVAEAALPGAAVTLVLDADPFIEPTDGSAVIVVRGTGVDLPFRGVPTELSVLLREDGGAGFVLAGRPGADWRMEAGFPPLAGTLGGTLPFAADAPATLTLRSHRDVRPAGLSLEGNVDLGAVTGGLADLLSLGRLPLDGTVTLAGRGSRLNGVTLNALVAPQLDLGIATVEEVQMGLATRLAYNTVRKRWDASSFLTLALEIPFTAAGKPRSLPLRAEVADSTGLVRFSADITDSVDAGLDEIWGLLGSSLSSQVSLTDHFPQDAGFELGSVIRLNDLFVDLDLAGSPRVPIVGLGIESVGMWKLFTLPGSGRDFALENVQLLFTLSDPFGDRAARMAVAGELKMGAAGVLSLRADSDDWTVQAWLKEGTTLRLSDIIQDFVGSGVSVPLVVVKEFDFYLAGKTYSLVVELVGEWPLDFGAFAWAITGLELKLTNDPALSPQVLLAGSMNVAEVDLGISAELPSPGGGWIFTGKTGPGQQVALGDLLDTLAGAFGVTVPDVVRSFYLSDFDVRVETGTRAIHFGCRGGFTLAEHEIALTFTLDVQPAIPDALPASASAESATTGAQPATTSAELASPRSGEPGTTGSQPAATGVQPRFDLNVEGTLAIGGSVFNLTFDKDPASTRFTAEWTAQSPDAMLQFGDITGLFGIELSEIPKELDLALDRASFTYDFTTRTLALTAHSRHYGGAAFIVDASGERTRFLFALEMNPGLNLRDLPVVGQSIPAELAFSIDSIAFWLASAAVSPADAGELAKLVPGGLPQVPAAGLAAGPALAVTLSLGEAKHTLMLGTSPEAPDPKALPGGSIPAGGGAATAATQAPAGGDASTASTAVPAAPAAASVPSRATGTDVAATPGASTPTAAPARPAPKRAEDGATWLDLQKTLGPLSLQRIGFRYRDGRISVLFDGGISIAGFSFSLMGLQVSSALQPPLEVGLGLDGLGLEVDRDPLLISGAFLRADEPGMDRRDWKYAGLVNVRIREFGLAAVGVYASRGGQSSLFVFGSMDTPLGGPPAFFVTGLSAGVGFNSRVRVPRQDEVQDFPLVAGLSGGPAPESKVQPSGQDAATDGAPAAVPAPDPLAVLDRLQGKGSGRDPWITDEPGHTWIAAGVQFTSFKMVNTRALLLANLGERDLSFALLGLSQAQLPPSGDKLFAQVGLQLAAVFKPLEGFLGVTAVLTRDSWLLDPACRLTGGFAFFLWFDGPHEGDFVLTVGGYHPSFPVPAHYPRVERLGFNWKVSDAVTLKGGTYFALTPSCIMAGVALEATYSSGNLKAWFRASADFLAQWHPFHFDARVAVSVGASYRMSLLFTTVTLSVEIGAELHLWGPPTGGTVHVDWAIISFTIPFGEQPGARPATLGWAEFGALLPPRDARLTLNLEGVQAGAGGERLARPDDLSFSTRSAIPATELAVAAPSAPARRTIQQMGALSIRPMGITDVDTPQSVTVTRDGAVVDLQKDGWTVEAVTQNHPQALWGAPLKDGRPAAPEAKLLRDQLVGLRVHAPRARAGFTPGPIDVAGSLGYHAVPSQAPLPLQPDAQQGGPAPAADPGTVAAIAATAGAGAAREARTAAFDALARLGAAPPAPGEFFGVARDAALLFPDAPMRAA